MSLFVHVGNHWINLETVISIEFLPSPQPPGEAVAVRIHFNTGKQQDFKAPNEIQDLEAFLRAHKAP